MILRILSIALLAFTLAVPGVTYAGETHTATVANPAKRDGHGHGGKHHKKHKKGKKHGKKKAKKQKKHKNNHKGERHSKNRRHKG